VFPAISEAIAIWIGSGRSFGCGDWARVAGAFVIFRLFDIVKPMPIRHFDRTIRNGLGVMFDDLLAAFYTLLCLAGWKFSFG
jgi:phosphatidylglycerophosphatase A